MAGWFAGKSARPMRTRSRYRSVRNASPRWVATAARAPVCRWQRTRRREAPVRFRRTLAEHPGRPMFFRFPPDARWNPERSVVEFGIGVGEYEGVVRVPRRVFQILLPEAPTPERCLEAYHLHRTRLEFIAERKVRRRQLTDDGNIEITGRDMRERAAPPTARRDWSSAGGYISAARERCLRWPPPRRCGDRR